MEYTLKMADEDIISIAEVLLLSLLSFRSIDVSATTLEESALTLHISDNIDTSITNSLRALLKAPLTDKRFREHFNHYFDTHPIDVVRIEGCKALDQILVWEDG